MDAAKRIFSLPHRTPANHAQPASLSHSSCVHPHVVNFVFVFAATDSPLPARLRSILINWLLAVIDEFQQDDDDGVFYTGAHHQTVAILDHYCQKVGTFPPSLPVAPIQNRTRPTMFFPR